MKGRNSSKLAAVQENKYPSAERLEELTVKPRAAPGVSDRETKAPEALRARPPAYYALGGVGGSEGGRGSDDSGGKRRGKEEKKEEGLSRPLQ